MGIATAKKIGCHARRNWVKRRIRQCLQSLDSNLRSDLDYIAIATPDVLLMSYEETCREIGLALTQMNLRWADDSGSF